ncbi:MAG: YceD family protein [Atopobiaceae bacterium]|jgi:uncharacterized protein
MTDVVVVLDERLESAGDTIPFSGHLEDTHYSVGEHEFSLPTGIDFDLVLTNAGEGILATGMLRAHVLGECDRCLDPAEFDVAAEVDEYFLFKAPEETVEDEEEGPDYSLVSPDHTLDLTEALSAALVMETPFVVLCSPDCKGLCPVCGANLNHEDCGHAAQIEQERLASSPFAALKDLDLGSGESKDA